MTMTKANMKCMICQLCHVILCPWRIAWVDITLVSIHGLAAHAEMEASHKDPVTLPIIKAKNLSMHFEVINKYFQGLRGCKGDPL